MLPINITELLEQNRIESNRIEYKHGWNPTAIYHSICAFANDFENLGGGYIVVGVDTDDETGKVIHPVCGVPEDELDKIQQAIVGFNNKFAPYYQPHLSAEEIDGRKVLVIQVSRGQNRPYTIPIDVTAKQSNPAFYVRSGTSSIRFFNYPYQALEEAVVNAFYHRDYQVYEPVEITIEPHRISILSFSGPDRSISMQSIKEAKSLRSRRYKNRRLGDFLNGLDLSEGWATGIPTIQYELEKNGSPSATIETDEGRTYFLIDIPCHPDFLKEEEVVTTLSHPISNLSQAWLSAMTEVSKNGNIYSSELLLSLCLNFVTTSVTTLSQPTNEAIDGWAKKDAYLKVLKMLHLLLMATSMKKILEETKETNRGRLLYNYVKPLLELELIKMKYPDIPNHHKQQYMLTEIGKTVLNWLEQGK